jgi:heme exporter protein D
MEAFKEGFINGLMLGGLAAWFAVVIYIIVMACVVLHEIHNEKMQANKVTCEVK